MRDRPEGHSTGLQNKRLGGGGPTTAALLGDKHSNKYLNNNKKIDNNHNEGLGKDKEGGGIATINARRCPEAGTAVDMV